MASILTNEEIKKILDCKETKIKFKKDNYSLFFSRKQKYNFWIQRIENKHYGLVVDFEGNVIPSYPHLHNINTEWLNIENCYAEEKVNGTNVGIAKINDKIIIRTRMSPFPSDFPIPTFFNRTLNEIKDIKVKEELLNLRKEITEKYKPWYVLEGDGTYTGLKVVDCVKDILGEILFQMFKKYPDYMFFFELLGKINPILVEGEAKYGRYDFDYKLILFDILDIKNNKFLEPAKNKKS